MHETVMKLARAITRPSEAEAPMLEALCAAAEAEVAGRLREGWTPEACMEPYCCAAALLAAAGLLPCREDGDVEQFTAGEVSLRTAGGSGVCGLAATLRRQAAGIMAPYWDDDSFAFMGVRG